MVTLQDGLMEDVADGSALVGEESIAVEDKDHPVGMRDRVSLKGEGQRAIGRGGKEGPC